MTSTDRSYFVDMYANDPDPWGFASRWYECRKYAITTASLPNERYANAFEPGCSIGVLSELLASRCDRLLVTDIIPAALEQARTRLQRYRNVEVGVQAIPETWPKGPFDLIVLSELAYYFDATTLATTINLAVDSTLPGAHLVAVHWHGTTDYPLSGEQAHEIIGSHKNLDLLVHHEDHEFILDIWQHLP